MLNTRFLFIALFVSFLVAGCCATPQETPGIRPAPDTSPAIIDGCDSSYLKNAYNDEYKKVAKTAAIYGMIANNTYESSSRPHFELPQEWEKVDAFENNSIGLYLELYERKANDVIEEVVVAFRGSDEKKDWKHGNFSDNQYDASDKFVREIQKRYPGTRITAVGHSLGGGLALHASTTYKNIDAYVFNTSPRVFHDGKVQKNYRLSISEKGDPLAKARFPHAKYKYVTRKRYHFPQLSKVRYGEFNFIEEEDEGSNHHSYSLARGLLLVGALDDPHLKTLLSKNCNLKKATN